MLTVVSGGLSGLIQFLYGFLEVSVIVFAKFNSGASIS